MVYCRVLRGVHLVLYMYVGYMTCDGSLLQYLLQYLQTALHMASENGHNETVRLLLERGADPNRTDVVSVVYI